MIKKLVNKLLDFFFDTTLGLTIYFVALLFFILHSYDLRNIYPINPIGSRDLFVEFYGLIFELLVIGIIFSLLEKKLKSKESIKSYLNDIENLKRRDDKLSKFNVLNRIEKLNSLGETKIDLKYSMLNSTNWYNFSFNNSNHSFSEIRNSNLTHCSFSNSDLSNSNISLSKIKNCHFDHVNLSFSNLEECEFEKCSFTSCDFSKSDLKSSNFNMCTLNNCNFSEKELVHQEDGIKLTAVKVKFQNGNPMKNDGANLADSTFRNCTIIHSNLENIVSLGITLKNNTIENNSGTLS